MRKLLCLAALLLPWPLRRRVLTHLFGFEIHPSARIGLAWVFPKKLVMEANSKIGHLSVCRGLDLVKLGSHASIGKGNWICGISRGETKHFCHQHDRVSALVMGDHSAVTSRHIIDCTNTVSIGPFSTIAGYRTQILSHSIDLEECRQSSAPVSVGSFTFVGTDCVLLPGSALPDRSVLGAKSLLNKAHVTPCWLYGGIPARPIRPITGGRYFSRTSGFVF